MKRFNMSQLKSSTTTITQRQQTNGEELANSTVHGIGAGLAIAGLAILVVFSSKYGDVWRIVSLSIYGASLFLLYLSSTLYHGFSHPKVKRIFRIFDHASIYLLIAGTYTPVTLVSLRGPWGWTLFGVIWFLAMVGILSKIFFMDKYRFVSVAVYLVMGWLIVIAFKPLMAAVPAQMIMWLAIGGGCYTLGLIFYAIKAVPFFHFIWHLFVLGGSITHFLGMLFYLTAV